MGCRQAAIIRTIPPTEGTTRHGDSGKLEGEGRSPSTAGLLDAHERIPDTRVRPHWLHPAANHPARCRKQCVFSSIAAGLVCRHDIAGCAARHVALSFYESIPSSLTHHCVPIAALDALDFNAPWPSATRKATSATAGTKIENLVPASACFCIREEHDRVSHGGVGWYCGAKSAYM